MRGGSRTGAGKKRNVPHSRKRTMSFSLDEVLCRRIEMNAAEAEMSISAYMNDLLVPPLMSWEEYSCWVYDPDHPEKGLERVRQRQERTRQAAEFAFWERYRQEKAKEQTAFDEKWRQWSNYDRPADPYGFAGLADAAAIKRRYRDLCKTHHPDAGGLADDFRKMQAAYEDALRTCKMTG